MQKAQYRQCGRKRKYSQRQAVRVAQAMNERQKKRVHPYHCDRCNQHHVGKDRKGNEELNEPMPGAEIYGLMDIAKEKPFDDLSPNEQLIYNLLAETAEEVLEEK